jgi:hypothetical protein
MSPERSPRPLVELLQLAGLWNIAIAQPVFDILARSPEFFVAHDARAVNVWAFVMLISLAMPLALWGAVRGLSRLAPAAAPFLVAVSSSGLLLLTVLYAMKQSGGASPGIAFTVAGVCAVAGAVSYVRYAPVRLFVTLLSLAIVLVPAAFVLQPPVSRLLGTGSREPLPTVDPSTTPPIVMVVFDELPLASLLNIEGQIDAERFPNFDALRREATWFRNASAVAELTIAALPPLLTGTLPVRGRLPVADEYPANLFTLLAPHYRMNVVEPLTKLCPDDLCVRERLDSISWLAPVLSDVAVVYLHTILPDDLAERLPPVKQNWRDFVPNDDWRERLSRGQAGDRPEAAARFIEQIEAEPNSARPAFHFLHMVLPHEPWVYLPTGQRFSAHGFVAGFGNVHGTWVNESAVVAFDYQRHLLQVGLVDSLLGRLMARLREVGLYEETLIVVAADHGASFRPGESFRRPSQATFADIAAVPLFVKRPHQREGRVVDENVWLLDVPATVAAELGVRLPWETDGANVFGAMPQTRSDKRLLYDDGDDGENTVVGPADLSAGLLEAVRWKNQILPTANPFEQPRLGRADELVGQSLERFSIRPGSGEIAIHTVAELGDVRRDASFIPSRIAGSAVVEGSETPTLAIVVNGVVAATTVPYTFPVAGRQNLWEVIVDPALFVQGANSVEVFEVRETPDEPFVLYSLYSMSALDSAAAGRNLSSESAEWLSGVTTSGLSLTEWDGTRPFRWSDGDARMSIPVDPEAPPSGLSISITMTGGLDKSLTIAVDDCALFDSVIQGPWSGTFSLGSCRVASERMEVSIRSTTHLPGNGDLRQLGVAIGSVEISTSAPIN